MSDDLVPTIATNAAGLKSAEIDGNSATAHSLPDQIAADKYIKSQSALSASPLGLRLVKLRPGGASDVDCR